MEKERAKEFLFFDDYRNGSTNKIYLSKDINKLIDINNGTLIGIYGIVDTESGEKLFEMDFAYSGEPILMRVFLHKDYFLKFYGNREIVKID